MTYTDLKTILKDFKRDPKKVLPLLFVVAVIAIFSINSKLSFEWSSTNYAPQSLENSPGATQIQAQTVSTTAQHPAVTTYKILKTSTSTNNGEYKYSIAVTTRFIKEGRLDINGMLTCIKDRDDSFLFYDGHDTIAYTAGIVYLTCLSRAPIPEGAEWFKYYNDNP